MAEQILMGAVYGFMLSLGAMIVLAAGFYTAQKSVGDAWRNVAIVTLIAIAIPFVGPGLSGGGDEDSIHEPSPADVEMVRSRNFRVAQFGGFAIGLGAFGVSLGRKAAGAVR